MKTFDITELDTVAQLEGGAPLVADSRNPKFANAIIAHERAAKAGRIVGTVSRATAR
ncbi:hypothetical protein [Agrobacterium sp. NPDC090283]|uniref:hypothetical protein n=1 Tax=Agrobacterium sp. NPDC090283 TaxID=3363920 RepID=UPI00383A753C